MSTTAVPLVERFSGTERLLHWTHTAGFLAMLGTGLLLYVPGFGDALGGRPGAKAAHLAASIAWLVAMAAVVLLGNRRTLRVTLDEIDRFGVDDRRWLRHRKPLPPQGRFNAGQKLHTVLQAGFAALFLGTGTLLWLSERVNGLRMPGTIVVHDAAMFLAVALLLGHLWLALVWPPTRHAMRGIVRGTVRADWAAQHHARWQAVTRSTLAGRGQGASRPGLRSALAVVAVVAAGAGATAFVVEDSLGDRAGEDVSIAPPASAATDAAAAAPPPAEEAQQAVPPPDPSVDPLALAAEAQQLQQAGRLNAAIERYRVVLRTLPQRSDVRASYGVALVDAGNTDEGLAQLRRATAARPSYAPARLVLGLTLQEQGRGAEARAQLRRYLRSAPPGPGADAARAALSRR